MKKTDKEYVKRTQKDYPISFKISVVKEIEETGCSYASVSRKYGIQGDATLRRWIEKFGNFDHPNKTGERMTKTKEQELYELREKVKLLERKNARLEHELEMKDHKVAIFDMMFDIAESEYKIKIRKNSSAEQSENTTK